MKPFFSYLLLSLVFAQSPSDPRQALIDAYSKKKSLLEDIAKIDQQATHVHQELLDLERSKTEMIDKKSELQIQLKNIAVQYQEKESNIISSMQMLYKLHRRGLARIIFGAEEPVSLRRRSTYLRHIIDSDQKQLQEFKTLAQTQKMLLKELESSENRIQKLGETLKQKERSLKMQREEKQNMLDIIQSERTLAQKLLNEVNQSQASFTNQISSIEKLTQNENASKNQNAAQVIKQEKNSGSTSQTSQTNQTNQANQANQAKEDFSDQYGKLPWPVQGTLLHRFGKQTNPITQETIKSLGIDIQAAEGTPVKAVHGGRVTLARFIDSYGNTIVIQHGSHSTVYAHLSAINVRQAEDISAGQIIGRVGSTGLTDSQNTAWLSFEVRYKKQPQDPLNWLKR